MQLTTLQTVLSKPDLPVPAAAPRDEKDGLVPPGLSIFSRNLIQYLPGIYHTDFMRRFLGIFEATLAPIEWNVDNFDLFLHPGTAPATFLPWLSNWYDLSLDPNWTESQRRALLKDAYLIYARRGTRWALSRVLEIFTGVIPEIDDTSPDLPAHTFRVRLPLRQQKLGQNLIEALIDDYKPAHTSFILEFVE